MLDEPEANAEPIGERYTAFEKWPYRQLIYVNQYEQSWTDFAESFYFGAEKIVDGVVCGRLFQDIEGVAGVYCFRHYLELALKGIIMSGRWLRAADRNAFREEVTRVAHIHDLSALWQSVIEDARPKFGQGDWDNYDIAFAEACVREFDERD